MTFPQAKRLLLSVLMATVLVFAGSPAHAIVIATPNTYRADFNFTGLRFSAMTALFNVGISDPLVAGESFSFTLFDSPGVAIGTNVFTASFDTGFFLQTFSLGPTDLVDGIGFLEVTGLSGQFDLAGAFINGRFADGEDSSSRELTFALVATTPPPPGPAPVPAPASYVLIAIGLGLLGFVVRGRRNARAAR